MLGRMRSSPRPDSPTALRTELRDGDFHRKWHKTMMLTVPVILVQLDLESTYLQLLPRQNCGAASVMLNLCAIEHVRALIAEYAAVGSSLLTKAISAPFCRRVDPVLASRIPPLFDGKHALAEKAFGMKSSANYRHSRG